MTRGFDTRELPHKSKCVLGLRPGEAKEIDMTNCPECAAALELSADVMAHEIIDCTACGAELEVTSIEPLTLALAPDEEEDWGE
jgi:alpha-aminoadipate/glutamate carrier protein LysW